MDGSLVAAFRAAARRNCASILRARISKIIGPFQAARQKKKKEKKRKKERKSIFHERRHRRSLLTVRNGWESPVVRCSFPRQLARGSRKSVDGAPRYKRERQRL